MLYKPIQSKLIIGDSAVSIRYGGGVYKSEHTYQVYLLVYTRSAMVNQNISELDQGKSATIGRIYIFYRTGRDANWSTRGRTILENILPNTKIILSMCVGGCICEDHLKQT